MLRVLFVGGCLLLPAPSFAQAKQPAAREVDFGEPDVIEGTAEGPDLGDVSSRGAAEFGGIIRVRQDFKEKAIASVAEL